MTYDEFVQHRLAQGDTPEAIQECIINATRPISGRCAFCGKEATLSCDYILGWTNMTLVKLVSHPPYWAFNTGTSMPLTCDTPLCDGCRNHRGMLFFHGSREHSCETEDWCPDHIDDTGDKRPVPMTEEEAEAFRRRRRMQLMAKLA